MIALPSAAARQVGTKTGRIGHAGIAKDGRVGEDDVGHRQENDQTRDQSGAHVGERASSLQ
jgi:hypothetical protein